MKKAVFPGTFDPITLGHVDIIKRAIPLFDEIIVAIGVNVNKKTMFSLDDRMDFIRKTFNSEKKIKVKNYTGLTVQFCKAEKAQFLIRGLRNAIDLYYEQPVAQTNLKMAGIETILLFSSPEISNISSTIVRDVLLNGGDISGLIPKEILKDIKF